MRLEPMRLMGIAVAAVLLAGAGRGFAQNPRGFIRSDAWACLLPLDGTDCTGGGEAALLADWVAPRSLAAENPDVGTVWNDIDFGGAARSGGYLGRGSPRFVRIPAGPDPDAVDFDRYLAGQGLPSTFLLAIAASYVLNTTEAPLRVGICTASDDSIQVWVNADLVLNQSTCRPLDEGCRETSEAVLAPGANRILVAVWQGIGDFGFRLGIQRPDGSLYVEGDPEVICLGALQVPPTLAGPLPALARSWEGDEYLCGEESHEIRLRGDGTFAAGITYAVEEEIRGPVAPGDLSAVSHGGKAEPILDATPRRGGFYDGVVGVPCSGGSGTSYDGELYTTRAVTGGDIWINGDVFAFAYQLVEGDFEVSIEILERRLPTSGRWNKFGIMARQSLETDSRFGHIQDLGPYPPDPARYARRRVHRSALSCEEYLTTQLLDPNSGEPLTHPRYLRLTREGDQLVGWVSQTAGDGGRNPRDDANWVAVFTDVWDDAPEELYLGFAFSVHESSGCAPGEIVWLPLVLEAEEEDLPPVGTRISWDAPGNVLDGRGLTYRLKAERGAEVDLFGRAGGSVTRGPRWMGFQRSAFGPAAPFDGGHDIGARGPCTPGEILRDTRGTPDPSDDAYRIVASGRDIWTEGDQFTFLHKGLTGDFDVRAKLSVLQPPPETRWGKFGLMARWDCRPDAAYFFVHDCAAADMTCEVDGPRTAFRTQRGVDGENREPGWVWWQDVFGKERPSADCGPLDPDPRANDLRGDARNIAPYLRLVRRGTTFYGYGSRDGDSWRLLGAHTWSGVPDSLLVGAAATSHADCGTIEVLVEQVAFGVPHPDPPPPPPEDPGDGNGLEPPFVDETFDGATAACPPEWICARWGSGAFRPRVTGGRLRLADLRGSSYGDGADVATSALVASPVPADAAYLAEFDLFFRYDAPEGDEGAPADGLTFCMLGVGAAGFPAEPPVGDRGEGLGYSRIHLARDERQRHSLELARNSFAVEFDAWHNGPIANDGDGGNASGWDPWGGSAGTGTGPYHVGLDVNGSVASVQRNHDLGVRDEDLPDIFDPVGVRVRVLYDGGRVTVWLSSNSEGGGEGGGLRVIDAAVEPLSLNAEAAIAGFTAATGGSTLIAEVDRFSLRPYTQGPSGTTFHRGDATADGELDISDPVFTLGYLFLGTSRPPCLEAADANDDGEIDITDPILVLGYLFLGGGTPAPPGPPPLSCGPDPQSSPRDLGCAFYPPCQVGLEE